jgi:hypothetical protein
MNLMCIIRANSYTKKSQCIRFYTIPRHVSVWINTIIRGTFMEHFETTEEKHSLSYV